MLRECFRVLKKGYPIRLVAPDLELIVRNYLKEIGKARNEEKRGYLPFEKFLDILGMGEKIKMSFVLKLFSSKHKWMYDEISLTALLDS